MISSLDNLKKILLLEVHRNYDNRSVFGGLHKICEKWKQDAIIQGVPINWINQICTHLEKYSTLNNQGRQETINIIFELIKLQEHTVSDKNKFESNNEKPNSPIDEKSDRLTPEKNIDRVVEYDIEQALSNPVIKIPGIGKYRADALSRLGIHTIKQLLYYFPKKHEDFSNLVTIDKLKFGEKFSVAGEVKNVHTRKFRGGRQNLTEVILVDDTGNLRITFFNQPFIERSIKISEKLMVSGKVETYMGRYVMNNPEWIDLEKNNLNLNRLYPYYSLTKNITQKWLRSIISSQINMWSARINDFFSPDFRNKAEIIDLPTAIKNIHFPESNEMLKFSENRFSFQDTFFLHLIMLQQKQSWQGVKAKIIKFSNDFFHLLVNKLPYSLTNAQKKCIEEILVDLSSGIPMSRLIQGDVGSGKTIVAAIIIAGVVKSEYQVAVMAPTAILAEQLFNNIKTFLLASEIITESEICFLSGDTPEKEKKLIRDALRSGKIKLAIGTHALIEDQVEFKNLELVVIDEQHRFGVMQRKKIRIKGHSSHLLVMTATPIPRTLALTIYGDLDLSIIGELPPGRKEIQTSIVNPEEKKKLYQFVRKEINSGSQAFIVYPLVESDDEDSNETNAAVNEYNRLKKEEFSGFSVGLLHGRMKPDEKELVMKNFRNGSYQVLITTTVIEVGVDVPNATIMMVEGANRFGLSQLHQLRGRVGRGAKQSYCFLIPDTEDAIENERLKAMVHTNDGFKLAEIDLSQRGPGDFIGIRQSGYKEIRFSNIMNVKLIEKARYLAREVLENDPYLINRDSYFFKTIMAEYMQKIIGEKN